MYGFSNKYLHIFPTNSLLRFQPAPELPQDVQQPSDMFAKPQLESNLLPGTYFSGS